MRGILARIRISLGVAFGLCTLVIGAFPAGATDVTLTNTAVKEFEYHANSFDESWSCNTFPVRLRLQVNFDGNDPVEVFRDRAGVDFSTASIPDNASILSVKLELYLQQDFTYNQPVEFKRLPSPVEDAEGAMCFGKYIQIGNGFEYVQKSGLVAGYNTIDLGPDAAADLQNQLTEDWFSVGMKMAFELLGDYSDVAELSSMRHAQPHRLKVKYLISFPDPKTSESPTETATWGEVKALFR